MAGHLTKILEIDAHGGPGKSSTGSDGYEMSSTTAGRYVISSIEKHVSYGKYQWSTIAWGTPLRFNNSVVQVQVNGRWMNLSSVNNSWGAYKGKEQELTQAVKAYYKDLKNYYRKDLPDTWVFNDFGHISVKYFADHNNNRRLDGRETIMGDFIHTTPFDEAATYYNNNFANAGVSKLNITLAPSHGCIHLKPAEIDNLIKKGYLKKGNTVEVHPYSETILPLSMQRKSAKPFFEFHFFPGLFRAAVYSVS